MSREKMMEEHVRTYYGYRARMVKLWNVVKEWMKEKPEEYRETERIRDYEQA